MGYILFDIGGTNTRLTFTEDCKKFEEPLVFETPSDFDKAMKEMGNMARKIADGRKIEKAVGGAPGPFNKEKTKIIGAPNLKDWIEKPLVKSLEEKFGAKVHLENDADLVGLGEAVFGAGKGANIVAYLTISTGVGGGRIVNQKIDANTFGFEPGHQIIDADKSICDDCPGAGTLENYIGGRAIEARMGMKSQEIADSEFWLSIARRLAIGLNNVVVFWSPDVIVLGGGVMLHHISIKTVEEELSGLMPKYSSLPQLKLAELEDFGGLYGAMHLAGVNS